MPFLACGGDGTVGWILSTMDEMELSKHERPAISIIPLGTGNDLSRSLNWGGKYRDKPLRKMLIDVAKADVVNMDRWSLTVSKVEAATTSHSVDDSLPLNVLNNYFSVGIDAHIALQFHKARNNNPEQFTSRTRNLLFYGLEGGKDLFKQQWRNLMDHVTIECDGVDYTNKLKAYGTHSVLFLNIKSYAGGTRPWNRKNGAQEINDGLLEVVAIDNLDLGKPEITSFPCNNNNNNNNNKPEIFPVFKCDSN
jgi:diacylglycerol kinase (ATP)